MRSGILNLLHMLYSPNAGDRLGSQSGLHNETLSKKSKTRDQHWTSLFGNFIFPEFKRLELQILHSNVYHWSFLWMEQEFCLLGCWSPRLPHWLKTRSLSSLNTAPALPLTLTLPWEFSVARFYIWFTSAGSWRQFAYSTMDCLKCYHII